METKFHFRVRALICSNDQALLVKEKGGGHTFLPGGHIELGEQITKALEREIKEELGEDGRVKTYLGAIENSWPDGNIRHYEINHIFELEIPNITANVAPVSREDHLEFLWSKIDELDKNNLLPHSCRALMKSWFSGERVCWWSSDFE